MTGFVKENSRNLVTLENFLILGDEFPELSLQRKIFSQWMLDNIIGNELKPLDYWMKILHRGLVQVQVLFITT